MQVTVTWNVQSKLHWVGEEQVQQHVLGWGDGADRGNGPSLSSTE